MRHLLIVGNWKMNGSNAQSVELLKAIKSCSTAAELVVCAPFVYLSQVNELLKGSGVKFGAQDVSIHVSGAYTGEIAATMLSDVGCSYVIVGHSERRQYHSESDWLVAQKSLAAIKNNLTPIICLGESLEERESNKALEVIKRQLQAVKSIIGDEGLAKSVIAYEPIWAIGTGLTATPDQAQEVHHFIRQQLGDAANAIHVLYGGSVKAVSAGDLFRQPDIDGALVGGASLFADEFMSIANAI